MTPEEARDLEPGTTPGPWEPHPNHPTMLVNMAEKMAVTMTPGKTSDHTAEDLANRQLIAAAPDMRATIAALRWEYAVENSDGDFLDLNDDAYSGVEDLWTWHRSVAEEAQATHGGTIVRRLGGPMEVVE